MDMAQLLVAAPASPVEEGEQGSPPLSPRRVASAADSWSAKYSDLKTQFVALQQELLALATSYGNAAEQLQFETECQAYVSSR